MIVSDQMLKEILCAIAFAIIATILFLLYEHVIACSRWIVNVALPALLRTGSSFFKELLKKPTGIKLIISAGKILKNKLKILTVVGGKIASGKVGVKAGNKTIVKATQKAVVKTLEKGAIIAGEKTGIKAGGKAVAKAGEKGVVKAAEKTALKAGEKSAVKAGGKAAVKTSEKSAIIAGKKAAVKAAEKSAVKAGEKVVVKSSEKSVINAGKKAAVKAATVTTSRKTAVKVGGKAVVKTGAIGTGKTGVRLATAGAKKIPVAGLLVGGAFGAWRAGWGVYYMTQGKYKKGASEFTKAGLEVAAGAVATVPGVGTGASVAIDVGLIAWDVKEAISEANTTTTNDSKHHSDKTDSIDEVATPIGSM